MMLIIGSSSDSVTNHLTNYLSHKKYMYKFIDENYPNNYVIKYSNDSKSFSILGHGCDGTERITSIYLRHAVGYNLGTTQKNQLYNLQLLLNRILIFCPCPIINSPHNAFSNFSKPYQLMLLLNAGFNVPKSMVTNISSQGLSFFNECKCEIIFKGVSNYPTFAQILNKGNVSKIDKVNYCPVLFQEFISGKDYRVHVVDNNVFVTCLSSSEVDYRRAAYKKNYDFSAYKDVLPEDIIKKCITITNKLGLIMSGIDFKMDIDDNLVVLELNPFPQFTFYESLTGQPITESVVNYLITHKCHNSNLLA